MNVDMLKKETLALIKENAYEENTTTTHIQYNTHHRPWTQPFTNATVLISLN